jgi:hypothetical protein
MRYIHSEETLPIPDNGELATLVSLSRSFEVEESDTVLLVGGG